ncbi:hypothetical protein [Actinoplanes sp. M2I2]|uniref:hypothetical protein n=1 Tax=Actinoplanes sp. M2I2 TaxID=1734444 RepID=UPI002020A31E|nr:hypothetical protein [Actinoplanes sp. M2I2]
MTDSSRNADRFDPDRLADWLLTGTGASPVRVPMDWLAVTDVLTTTIHLALRDHSDWRRYVDAYSRALVGMEQAAARPAHEVSLARSAMIGMLAERVAVDALPDEWRPERVAETFFERLSMSLTEATAMIETRERPPLPDMIRLRHLKQMLNRVQTVTAFLPAETVDRLRPWLVLRDRLP